MQPEGLQTAAKTYSHLRGLLSLPVGALMVIAALGNWSWGPFGNAWVFLGCVLATAGVAISINRYYSEHFGRITATTGEQLRLAAISAGVVGLVIGGSLILRSTAGWSLDLPVNPLAATLAAGSLSYYALAVGLRRHHLVIWGGLLVAGLLPVWGGLSISDTDNVGLLLAGLAAMLCGIFDHHTLVRSFGAARVLSANRNDSGA